MKYFHSALRMYIIDLFTNETIEEHGYHIVESAFDRVRHNEPVC